MRDAAGPHCPPSLVPARDTDVVGLWVWFSTPVAGSCALKGMLAHPPSRVSEPVCSGFQDQAGRRTVALGTASCLALWHSDQLLLNVTLFQGTQTLRGAVHLNVSEVPELPWVLLQSHHCPNCSPQPA